MAPVSTIAAGRHYSDLSLFVRTRTCCLFLILLAFIQYAVNAKPVSHLAAAASSTSRAAMISCSKLPLDIFAPPSVLPRKRQAHVRPNAFASDNQQPFIQENHGSQPATSQAPLDLGGPDATNSDARQKGTLWSTLTSLLDYSNKASHRSKAAADLRSHKIDLSHLMHDELRAEADALKEDSPFRKPEIRNIAGNATEIIVLKSSKWLNQPKIVVLFLPGNPGVIDAYSEFITTLFLNLRHEFNVDLYGASYLGHTRATCNGRHYTLHDEVEHQMKILNSLRKEYPPDTKFVLAAHSTGVLMSLKIMDRNPDTISQLFAVFPALDDLYDSPRGTDLKSVAEFPRVYSMLLHSLRVLLGDERFKMFVKGQVPKVENRTMQIALEKLVHYTPMYNSMKLFRETAEVTKKMDTELVGRFIDRTTFFYSPIDHWIPVSRVSKFKQTFPNGKVLLCGRYLDFPYAQDPEEPHDTIDIPHDFVFEQSAKMGRLIASEMKPTIRELFDQPKEERRRSKKAEKSQRRMKDRKVDLDR